MTLSSLLCAGFKHLRPQASAERIGQDPSSSWHQHPYRTRFDSVSSELGHSYAKGLGHAALVRLAEPSDRCSSRSDSTSSDTFRQDTSSGSTLQDELSAELGELLRLCDRDVREQHHMLTSQREQCLQPQQQQQQQQQQSPAAVRLLHCIPPHASEERRRQPRPKRKNLTSPTVRRSLKASFDRLAEGSYMALSSQSPLLTRWQHGPEASTSGQATPTLALPRSKQNRPHSRIASLADMQWAGEAEPSARCPASAAAGMLTDLHASGQVHGGIYSQVMDMLEEQQASSNIQAHVPARLENGYAPCQMSRCIYVTGAGKVRPVVIRYACVVACADHRALSNA